MGAEAGQLEPADVVAGEVEAAGAGEVDEGGGGGGEGAVPQVDKVAAALVALFCLGEDFFRFEVEEAHAHGAVAHDAFEMADAAAAAVALFGVEGDGDVAALPDAFYVGPAAVADAVADGPDAGELFQAAVGGGDAGGDGVGVVGGVDGSVDAAGGECFGEIVGQAHAFDLGEIGRVFNDAVADDAGDGDADGVERAGIVLGEEGDLAGEHLDEFAGGQGCERVGFGRGRRGSGAACR